MSVLIKGMEMPKSCSRCFCMASCRLWKNIMHPEFNRHRNCPLVPVPPHGDLIDRDALNYTMLYKENWMSGTGIEAPAVWKKDIEDAPTIIPAEEGET